MHTILTEPAILTGIVQLKGDLKPGFERVLTPEALDFLADLHERFNSRRAGLLELRIHRQRKINSGKFPDFLPSTKSIRESDWTIEPVPAMPPEQTGRNHRTG
jgi:malate synthase